jgi:hypothetical protein
LPALGVNYVSDHLDKVKEAFQTNNHRFQTYFIALLVFSLFFFFAILLPYIVAANERYGLEQENKTKTEYSKSLRAILNVYDRSHNNSTNVSSGLDTASSNIKSVSLLQADEREFNSRSANLSNTTGDSLNPRIASFGDNVYVVWKDIGYSYEQIVLSNGTRSIVLANTSKVYDFPDVSVSGDNVYVVWSNGTNEKTDIYFSKSIDGGESFTDPENLSDNKGHSDGVRIAVSGDRVYVVWSDDTSGNHDIYFRQSLNNGTDFGNITDLSVSGVESTNPQISTFQDSVSIAWVDRRSSDNENVVFTRSIDNGKSFLRSPITLDKGLDVGYIMGLRIASLEDYVHVIWSTQVFRSLDNIYLASSKDKGTSFGNPINISVNVPSSSPDIALSKSNVYVVWDGIQTTNSNIYFRRSINNGSSFENREVLSMGGGNSEDPRIVSFGENVYVVWIDNLKGSRINLSPVERSSGDRTAGNLATSDVFFRANLHNGEKDNFISQIDLSNGTGSSASPQLSVSADSIYVVWVGDGSGNKEILLSLDKSGLHEKVLDRFSSYRNILRDTIIVPFQDVEKRTTNNSVRTLLPAEILQNIRNNINAILLEAETLDSDLLALSSNIIEKSENKTLLNVSRVESPNRIDADILPLSSENIRTSNMIKQTVDVTLEDDIQRRITKIEEDINQMTGSLQKEQASLSSELKQNIQEVKQVDDELNKLSQRLEAIETPLGPIPVGLKDSIPIFPILVAAGIFICFNLLDESICLRKTFHILYNKKYKSTGEEAARDAVGAREIEVTPEQIALIVPMWIDPYDPRPKRFIWFIVLLIPIIVYLISVAWVWTSPVNLDGIGPITLYDGIYVVLFVALVVSFTKIFHEIHTYKKDVGERIAKNELPKCGKR